jgi:ATP synthase protein I
LTHRSLLYRFRATFEPRRGGDVVVAGITERRMPHPEETREEAIRRLQQRAGALETRATPTQRDYGAQAHSYGYRLLGLLLGGVFVGLGLGWAIDAIAKTGPFGMIIGVLVGFVVSVWMAVRSAQRMSEEISREWGPPSEGPAPDDGEDD